MAKDGYEQFCPVAMAAEVLCTRWTIVLLREFMAGSTRFNALRRGVPRMSPALLSLRLKELEAAGVVSKSVGGRGASGSEYRLTDAGRELIPIIQAFGVWGQRWIDSDLSLSRLDAQLLMWDMRRNLDPDPLPPQRSVIRFVYPEVAAAHSQWWLIVEPGTDVDLCSVDPGHDLDLDVRSDLRTMTAIWMGRERVDTAVADGRLALDGDAGLRRSMQKWLGLSPFAKIALPERTGLPMEG